MVTNDIVTRLRNEVTRCWCAEKSQNEPVGKPFFRCESCDNQLRAAAEIERLRALMTAFVSAWERSELGENNGSEYFNAVHAMRQAVRGD